MSGFCCFCGNKPIQTHQTQKKGKGLKRFCQKTNKWQRGRNESKNLPPKGMGRRWTDWNACVKAKYYKRLKFQISCTIIA